MSSYDFFKAKGSKVYRGRIGAIVIVIIAGLWFGGVAIYFSIWLRRWLLARKNEASGSSDAEMAKAKAVEEVPQSNDQEKQEDEMSKAEAEEPAPATPTVAEGSRAIEKKEDEVVEETEEPKKEATEAVKSTGPTGETS